MANTPYPWFRVFNETGDDAKFSVVADETGMSHLEVVGVWTILMCLANGSPLRGSLYATLQKRFSNTSLAKKLHITDDQMEKLLKSFTDIEILEIDKDGGYHFKNWEKRQFTSDLSTVRSRKSREGKKDATLPQRPEDVAPLSSVNLLSTEEIKEQGKLSAYMANRLEINELAGGSSKWGTNIQRLLEVGISPVDIENGLKWMDENNRPVRGLDSVIGSILTAKKKRVARSGKPKQKTVVKFDANGNSQEFPA